MAFFEDFTGTLKQKWLQYFQTNRDWLILQMKVTAVKTPDGGQRPPSYFILGVINALEPKLAQLMLPFSKLNPDPETLIDVLNLNFDPDLALGNRTGEVLPDTTSTGDVNPLADVAIPEDNALGETQPPAAVSTPASSPLGEEATLTPATEEKSGGLGALGVAAAVGLGAAAVGLGAMAMASMGQETPEEPEAVLSEEITDYDLTAVDETASVDDMDAGLGEEVSIGLDDMDAGLGEEVSIGLDDMDAGLGEEVSIGLDDMDAGLGEEVSETAIGEFGDDMLGDDMPSLDDSAAFAGLDETESDPWADDNADLLDEATHNALSEAADSLGDLDLAVSDPFGGDDSDPFGQLSSDGLPDMDLDALAGDDLLSDDADLSALLPDFEA